MSPEIQQERVVLESIARGVPLREILSQIARGVERQARDMFCSLLLLDRDGKHVRHGAAPSLPPEFCQAIDGLPIGPRAGSCGTAAFRRERVVVEDILQSDLWADYLPIATPFGLRACWSTPIFSPEHEVLGTFAMYYREPRRPTEPELAWIDSATDLAAIAILLDRAAEALRHSEARYRQIVDTAYEGVWVFDADGRTLFVNQRTGEMLGYAAEEIIGRTLLEFVDADERERVAHSLRRRKEHTSEQYELSFRRKDGTAFWAMVAASPLRGEGDDVVGMLRMITDITQLKRTESALRQSEAEFRAVFESSAIGMALVDADGHPVRSNPALERALGYTAGELRRMAFAEFTHPDDVRRDVELYQRLLAGERDSYQIEKRYLRKNGDLMWGRLTVSLIRREDGAPVFGIGMVEDVTDRKKMEETVRSSERLRALVYNGTSDILFYIGVEGENRFRYLSVNPAFSRATGLSEEQVVGKLLQEILAPASAEIAVIKFTQAMREKHTVSWEETVSFPAGVRYGEISVTPLCDDNGKVTNLVGAVHDVTERKQHEERIIAQAALLDRARDAILLHDIDGRVRYWNHGAERLYGWSSSEAVGRNVVELIYRDTTARERARMHLASAGEWNGELVQWTKAGKRVIIDASWTLLSEPGAAKSVLSINTDITARKNLELQVHRAQRLESLGTLAGGVAHDFNNILAAIMANVACAGFSVPGDHPAREYLIEIEKASLRATDLVRQILTFSRNQETSRRQAVKLALVAAEAAKLLRSTLPPKVELQTAFAADVPDVLAEPTQVHQVVMNLGTNAVHAMTPGPGVLTVSAERVVLDGPLVVGAVQLAPGPYARLTVEDTGSGMNEATLERIFDPFFTTKEPGKGTGLGLSVVHGIMKSYSGGIGVRSAPGKGTAFMLYFPALELHAPETLAPASAGGPVAGPRGGRILCVDDEPAIVQVMTRLLELRGYRVSGFSDAARALQEFEADPGRFDAVVTDVLMPGLSGFDFARRVLSVRPRVPIVVTSGHIGPEEFATLSEIGVQEFVLKPTVIDELQASLERVLGSARVAGARPGAG